MRKHFHNREHYDIADKAIAFKASTPHRHPCCSPTAFLPVQFPANGLEKADGPVVGTLPPTCRQCFKCGPALAMAAIWGINQLM